MQEEINIELKNKYEKLKEYLKSLKSLVIAFSGGVDSTFLLKVAKEALGENVVAVTAKSASFPDRERKEAENFCKNEDIKYIQLVSEELQIEGFSHNPKNRCYLCKKELFNKILDYAQKENISYVAEGSNLDDNGDYRPGLQAIKELEILSPLRHIGFTKEEIRSLSKYLNLPTWNKPSFACLASRFVYGEIINEKKLSMVDRAEQILLNFGLHQVRVRIHGENLARIEVMPDEFDIILKNRDEIYTKFKSFGFDYITMDLKGYRTGSMNEVISNSSMGTKTGDED